PAPVAGPPAPGAPVKAQPPALLVDGGRDQAVIAAYLTRLELLFLQRRRLLDEPTASWADLAAVEEPARRLMAGLGWLAERAAKGAEAALEARPTASAPSRRHCRCCARPGQPDPRTCCRGWRRAATLLGWWTRAW